MSSDAARDRLGDAVDALRSRLADVAAVQKNRAALRVDACSAGGTVEVIVNAQGQLVDIAIDTSYLDDHDFDELAGYILEAARQAAEKAGRRVAQMLAPINKRDRSLPTFSDIVEGLPDLADVMPAGLDAFISDVSGKGPSVGGVYDDGDDGAEFPTVRR